MTLLDPAIADPTRADELDAADPLGRFRDEFVIADPALVYLDGNSLGRLPRRTAERLAGFVADGWGDELVRGWDHWVDLPLEVGDRLGTTILGAAPGQVTVSDSTTVNVYKLALAALHARPERRVAITDRDNFPTDRYVLEGICTTRGAELRWIEGDPVDGPRVEDIRAAVDETTALVTLSHVNYRSGAIADVAGITRAAHSVGALVLWDLSHSAGSVPVELDAWNVDLAVGCTYKYLNSGPGAPAFLYVRHELQGKLQNPIQGWFGQRDQFAMAQGYDPAPGIVSWLTGTPTVTALEAIDAGVRLVAEAGIDAIRAKGIALTEYAIGLHDAWLAPLGFTLGTPRDSARRGAHIAVRRADGKRLSSRLGDAGVVTDFREPDSIRLGLSPLTTSFADVRRGIERLTKIAAA